jgi:polyisoprenoid-binding protein YceI
MPGANVIQMIKHYLLDSQASRFTVQAFAAGMLGGFAHSPKLAIRTFEGELRLAPDLPAKSSFSLTVQSSSLELIDNVKEKDRVEIQKTMMEEVLETNKYGEISYRCAEFAVTRIAEGWYRAQMPGELRLHGISRPISIDSQLRLVDRDARLNGEFSLSLTDYKLKRVTALGGLIKLKDELKFVFDLVGHEQVQE